MIDENPLVIGRAAEADGICSFISEANSRLVVLCGEAASGKTVLVTRWLLPALEAAKGPEGYRIVYGACSPAFPDTFHTENGDERFEDLLAGRSIIVVDDFDLVLDLPRDERRAATDRLFARLSPPEAKRRRSLELSTRQSILVVVVSARNLTSIYALGSYDPQIVNTVCMLKSIGLAEGLSRLDDENPDTRIVWTPAALRELEAEAKENAFEVTFDLLHLIHAQTLRYLQETGGRTIDVDQYKAIGGLTGMLRGHLAQQLEKLETERMGAEAIARAILHRMLDAQARRVVADLSDIGPRFDVTDAEVQTVLAGLTRSGGLLLPARAPGQFQFQPPQIAPIVDADRASREVLNERGRGIVEEGLRGWHLLGTYLPRSRFVDVHRQRHHLVLQDNLVRFLMQCALQHENAELIGASAYWFRRLASRDDGIDVLLAALFDSSPDVRARAATLLGECPDTFVRDRLCVLALTDTAPTVQEAAIASLARMADESLLETLRREAENPRSPTREQAVGALSIFPRADVSALLQHIVADRTTLLPVRAKAVSVLATLGIRESVDALVDIALNDEDVDDREAAGKALSRFQTAELNRQILSRLRWRRPTIRIAATALGLGLLLTMGAAPAFLMFAAVAIAGWLTKAIFGLLGFAVITGVLLTRVVKGKTARRSPLGILTLVMFAICSVTILPFVHGLGHVMADRTRRGVALIAIEAVGALLFFVVAGATEFVPGLGGIAVVYRAIGLVLFVGSYYYDVLGVVLGTFLLRAVTTREVRRDAIYREVFLNPAMEETVFADLRSAAPEARRADRLIRRYGKFMLPRKLVEMFTASDPGDRPHVTRALANAKDEVAVARLEALWPDAPAEQRRRITAVLTRKPTARSIEALGRLSRRHGAGMVFTIRSFIARLQFRLNVWPLAVQLTVLAAVPAAAVLLYHGTMIAQNHAWGEIMLLRQPITSTARKVKIVDFLVDVYPGESASELRRLFREGQTRDVDSLHAALARALVAIQDSGKGGPGLSEELASELPRFIQVLSDSTMADLGIAVLAKMAASTDANLADGAVSSLVEFASNAGGSAPAAKKQRAVRAIAAMPYARALPALDTVLKAQLVGKVQSKTDANALAADSIRTQISRAAKRAYAAIPPGGGRDERLRLLGVLQAHAPDMTELIAQLTKEVGRDASEASACDQTADSQCDGKVEALRRIRSRPGAEEGYRDLLSHFTPEKKYAAAESAFVRLVAEYPDSIWPHKILAEIQHEYISPADNAAFERAYAEMTAMRRLEAYRVLEKENPQDYVRVEADFSEIALTARHFDESAAVGKKVLAASPSATQRYNMTLFPYIAAAVSKDSSAPTRLAELKAVVRTLAGDYYNNWVYPGTLAFIQRSDLPADLKLALSRLCREGEWYKRDVALGVIDANSRALDHAAQK